MYARITQLQINPLRFAEMRAALPGISASLQGIAGMVEWKTCWDENGKGLVFALYESQTQAEAASGTVRGVLGGLSSLLTAAPVASAGTEVHDLLK
jgi:hypothetical protein